MGQIISVNPQKNLVIYRPPTSLIQIKDGKTLAVIPSSFFKKENLDITLLKTQKIVTGVKKTNVNEYSLLEKKNQVSYSKNSSTSLLSSSHSPLSSVNSFVSSPPLDIEEDEEEEIFQADTYADYMPAKRMYILNYT